MSSRYTGHCVCSAVRQISLVDGAVITDIPLKLSACLPFVDQPYCIRNYNQTLYVSHADAFKWKFSQKKDLRISQYGIKKRAQQK